MAQTQAEASALEGMETLLCTEAQPAGAGDARASGPGMGRLEQTPLADHVLQRALPNAYWAALGLCASSPPGTIPYWTSEKSPR